MGVVFAGVDTTLGRRVAIKVISLAHAGRRNATGRLLREARLMARLEHPGAVRLFDQGADDRFGAFLIMELLSGEDLAAYLQRRGTVPLPLALGMMERICDVLAAAHDAGVLHHDIKPANVFVLRHDETQVPRIKLLDFGAAIPLPRRPDGRAARGDERLLGTLAYMAPERWSSTSRRGVAADVYALGALLHEMLCGRPPFVASTRAGLRLAVLHDPPPPLVLPGLPPPVAAAIGRALDKRPERRPPSVRALAALLGLHVAGGGSRAVEAAPPPDRGTDRYLVTRALAAGFGTEVYLARDAETGREVAMKRLSAPTPEIAGRARRLFRAAAAVRHPSLPHLHGLRAERDKLLLIAQWIDGRPLREHLPQPEERLRAHFATLADALAKLHARGLSHGEVTAANVRIDGAGRAFLVDLGTASYFGDKLTRADAPPPDGEAARQEDLRGLGVVLYQALGGRPEDLTRSRRMGGPVAPLPPGAPGDLVALCRQLIGIDRRDDGEPDAETVAAALRATPPPSRARAARAGTAGGGGHPFVHPFVGRHDALVALADAVERLERGRPGLIWIEGPSGIGKTALLEELKRVLGSSGRVLALSGCARDVPSVPFPALDGAIEQLAAHLVDLPAPTADLLVPRRCGPLGHLFPTLSQVPAIARGAAEAAAATSPAEERRLASDALRELLRRVGDRQPVLLLLDDMQWLDPDSAALLERTLGGPDPPALLLVGAVRTDDALRDAELLRLETSLTRETVARIALGPLSPAESREMAAARWTGDKPLPARTIARLARLSGGVPLFMEMLVTSPERRLLEQATSLEDVLVARLDALPPRARRALELISVSSRPLRMSILLEAIGARGDAAVLDPLLSAALVRLTRADGEWAIEPYHARVRESIADALSPAARRARHRRLATLLRGTDGPGDIEATIEHLAGCGDRRAAADLARRAAGAANEQLAFDRAAALFEVVLEHGRPDRDRRVELLRQRATALENAGRRREAGATLLRAAAEARDAGLAAALQREAGSHLLAAGDVTRGLQVLLPALARAGVDLPLELGAITAATGAALEALGARGLAPAPFAGAPAPDARMKVDLLLDLALGLAHVDLRALPFACQALLEALELGEPQRLQRASALFVINTVEYVPTPLLAPALALCRELTGPGAGPLARALLEAALAENAHFEGDFLSAEAAFERAERTVLESGVKASRELATIRDLAVFVQYAHKGDFRTQLDRTQHWLAQAEAAQDVFHAGMLRVAHAIVWIARDDTARARSELRRAQTESIGTAGVLEVAVALYYDIIDRYEGDDEALAASGEDRSELLRSPAARTPFLSGYLGLHAAWRALRALGAGQPPPAAGRPVSEIIDHLRGLRMGIWSAVADALEGNLQFLHGQREAALRALEQGEQTFRRLHMLCLAACVRKRRGQFVDGDLGARLEAEADAELVALGVADIPRWTAAYWSMFDARAVADRTRDPDADGGTGWAATQTVTEEAPADRAARTAAAAARRRRG
jgi:serine/threonine protein kinase